MTKQYMWVRFVFLGVFLALIGIRLLFKNEDTGGWFIGGVVLTGIAVFVIVNILKGRPKKPDKRGLVMGSPFGDRIKSLFSDWTGWVEVASVLGIVGAIGIFILKLKFLPVFVMMVLSFLGFALLEFGRLKREEG